MLRLFSLVIAVLLFLLSSCYVFKAYRYRNFELKNLDKLAYVSIASPAQPFQFANGDASYSWLKKYLDTNLLNSQTYSFLVIKNDSILYEKYFGEVSDTTLLPSFSVAKSFVGTLIAIAKEEGSILSYNDPLTDYIPELKARDSRFEKITIQHLLDMRSGIKSNESYSNPFSDVLKLGFSRNIWRIIKKLRIESDPGKDDYKSVNTQLLGIIVERATGKKLHTYLQEKIWQPLGMESDATWNIDSYRHGMARAFCCINATTRDFAKFGRLYMNKGNWNGTQIVSREWVNNSTHPDTLDKYNDYKNQWWGLTMNRYFEDSIAAVNFYNQMQGSTAPRSFIDKQSGKIRYYVHFRPHAFHAEGILGQFIYVNPEKHLVIVRTGHYWSHPRMGPEYFIYNLGVSL